MPTLPTAAAGVIALLFALTSIGAPMQSAADGPIGRASQPVPMDVQRHQGLMLDKDEAIRTGGPRLVFIGDSITDFWRQAPQHIQFEGAFGQYRPLNLGVSGEETQHVLWRIQQGELDGLSPQLVVLLIGTNSSKHHMSAEETAEGIRTLVSVIRQKLPGSKLLLLGIFPRGATAADPLRSAIQRTNALIARLAGGAVTYLDIGRQFLDTDGRLPAALMPDYLHPSAQGYEVWADAMGPTMANLMR